MEGDEAESSKSQCSLYIYKFFIECRNKKNHIVSKVTQFDGNGKIKRPKILWERTVIKDLNKLGLGKTRIEMMLMNL